MQRIIYQFSVLAFVYCIRINDQQKYITDDKTMIDQAIETHKLLFTS